MEDKINQLKKLETTNNKLSITAVVLIIIAIILIIGIVLLQKPLQDKYCSDSSSSDFEESQRKSYFNESFTQYLGRGISAQQVKGLINAVNASNSKNPEHQITLSGKTKVTDISIKERYNAIEEYDEDGYIYKITITEKGSED